MGRIVDGPDSGRLVLRSLAVVLLVGAAAVAVGVSAAGVTSACGSARASKAGGLIAYVDAYWEDIYVVNADGGGLCRLTVGTSKDSHPAWSPDGKRLAFERADYSPVGSNEKDVHQARVMNADGSGQRRLAWSDGSDFSPAWSPDGTKIALTRETDDRWAIYVMNVDGSRQRRLTHQGAATSPAWSPDGRMIAFSDSGSIFVIRASGGGRRFVQHGRLPTWSPDGTRISFESATDIWVVNVDGSRLRRLTRGPGSNVDHVWSPDGRRIAFATDRTNPRVSLPGEEQLRGANEIYVMNADGSGQRNLTRNPADDSSPAWSPDGRKLVFISDRGGSVDIHTMDADGSGRRRITRSETYEHSPVWQPLTSR